jgi:signal recognition particle GTPase
MGLFDKFRDGFKKTQDKLVHEIKRIVTFSPRLTEATLEELEEALIGADFGTEMSAQIVDSVRTAGHRGRWGATEGRPDSLPPGQDHSARSAGPGEALL